MGVPSNMVQFRVSKELFDSFCGAERQSENGTYFVTMSQATASRMNTTLSAALRGQVYPVKKKKKKKNGKNGKNGKSDK